jgi:HPt (histidine-containing phosphotransfer) domain-containing protein
MSNLCNLAFLKNFTANDPLKIKKYVGMFLASAPQSIQNMQSQVAAEDWKSLRTTAHSLKSQVKYMGISIAEELAVFIEKSAAEGTDLNQLPAKISELESITSIASAELQQEIDKL